MSNTCTGNVICIGSDIPEIPQPPPIHHVPVPQNYALIPMDQQQQPQQQQPQQQPQQQQPQQQQPQQPNDAPDPGPAGPANPAAPHNHPQQIGNINGNNNNNNNNGTLRMIHDNYPNVAYHGGHHSNGIGIIGNGSNHNHIYIKYIQCQHNQHQMVSLQQYPQCQAPSNTSNNHHPSQEQQAMDQPQIHPNNHHQQQTQKGQNKKKRKRSLEHEGKQRILPKKRRIDLNDGNMDNMRSIDDGIDLSTNEYKSGDDDEDNDDDLKLDDITQKILKSKDNMNDNNDINRADQHIIYHCCNHNVFKWQCMECKVLFKLKWSPSYLAMVTDGIISDEIKFRLKPLSKKTRKKEEHDKYQILCPLVDMDKLNKQHQCKLCWIKLDTSSMTRHLTAVVYNCCGLKYYRRK